MATKTNELPLAQSVSLTDNLLVDTPAGTKILPVGRLPQALTADKLLMPGSNMSITEYYRQYSNRNLLDNAYWAERTAIINQRGKTEYTEKGYAIDRWYLGYGAISIENGLTITASAGFYYRFEDISAMVGKTFTFSVLTSDGLTSGKLVIPSGTADKSFALTINENDNMTLNWFVTSTTNAARIFAHPGTTLIAAKLELGSNQTLAHKEGDIWVLNDPLPNPALELAKCQRYYVKIAPGTIEGSSSMPLGIAHIGETEYVNFQVIVPTPMRANPSMKYHNLVLVDMTANTRTNLPDDGIVTITDCSAGNVHVNIRFEGWNLDNTHFYRIFVNAGGFLEFSSDL